MLPEDFEWKDRYQYARGELALVHGGKQVAMLLRRADGGWMARLWCHWPLAAPLVSRKCSSFEAGRAGVEAWALRHEAQIRAEVAAGKRLPTGTAVSGPRRPV